jgi:AcrR family transcriptional regulator
MSVIDTRPINRAERRKQHTRAILIQAATELLFERGYLSLTLQAITDRADVGYGTFYLHFQDKDDIVWAVLRYAFDIREKEIEATLADVPHPRREYLSWVIIFRYTAQQHREFLDIFGNSAVLAQRYQKLLAEVHRQNLEAGTYRSPISLPVDYLVQFITGALWNLLFWYAENPSRYTPEQMADMLFETLFRQPPPASE